jgi:predicted Zn-dependent protease
VLITRGLYELLENESQLAGVLGHEIAHILKRHHITVMQKQGLLQGVSSAGQAALGSRGGAGNAVGQLAAGAASDILTKGLDKSAEYEADHLGVVLAARAGYTPHGLVEVLHKLEARAGDPSLGLLFSTHPHPGDRLSQLGGAMTPRLANLPTGAEPALRGVSAKAPAARTGSARAPAGVRSMQQEEPQHAQSIAPAAPAGIPATPASGSGGGGALDAGSLLRGLMRR